MEQRLSLKTDLVPRGNQPKAIKELAKEYKKVINTKLTRVTGSGKTFTMAGVIEAVQKPTLVIHITRLWLLSYAANFAGFSRKCS